MSPSAAKGRVSCLDGKAGPQAAEWGVLVLFPSQRDPHDSSADLRSHLKSTELAVTAFFLTAGSLCAVSHSVIQSLHQRCEATEGQMCSDLLEVIQIVSHALGFVSVPEARTCLKINERTNYCRPDPRLIPVGYTACPGLLLFFMKWHMGGEKGEKDTPFLLSPTGPHSWEGGAGGGGDQQQILRCHPLLKSAVYHHHPYGLRVTYSKFTVTRL